MYSLEPSIVKSVLDAKFAGKPFDANQFLYYHLHRNHFNVKGEITQLTKTAGGSFRDNLGYTWTELSTFKNFFHMPKPNWVVSAVGLSTPYSRKFIRDDNVTGLRGEFEMIIKSDGKRIDALTHEGYQETYNFGKTRNESRHIALDVKPHNNNPNYAVKINTGRVRISE